MNVRALGREDLRQVSHLHRRTVRGWTPRRASWTGSPTFLAAVVTGIVTIVLRLSYAATAPTDALGTGLVAGSRHFDVRRGAPPAGGAWLYVAVSHAVHVVTGLSPVHSLVLVAALASAGAAALTCVAGTALAGLWVGLAAAALVASAPVSWFAGSTVSTAGFETLIGALLLVLARRARPYRAHGPAALFVLMLGSGVRLSVIPAFVLLAAIAVVASVRTVGQLLATVIAGAVGLALWFVPVAFLQPGGLGTWFHAVHVQVSHATEQSSVVAAPASGVLTNVGTFGGWSLVSVALVVGIGLLGIVTLIGARVVTGHPAGNSARRIWSTPSAPTRMADGPWYQRTGVILGAAVIAPVALVTLGPFTGGGDVLWYLAPVTVLVLLPVGRLLHHRHGGLRVAAALVATVLVAATMAVNVQRFVAAPGILPATVAQHHPHWWISEHRYQAPYPETVATIRAADRRCAASARCRARLS